MSLVIGVTIEGDRLRAVGVRGVRVLWGMDAPLPDAASLSDTLREFLAKLPPRGFGRPRVIVALGPTFAQTKRLAGLPPITDERLLAKTVSEHAARFFLKNGVPLVTTSVRCDATGQPWAAALQKTVVDTIVAVCRASRLKLVSVVPAVDVSKPDLPALATLGRDAIEFAAAYGAAVTPGGLAWRARGMSEEAAPRWRLALIVGTCFVALLLAILAPGLGARAAEHRALMHLARLGKSTGAAQRAAHDNDLVTRALGEVATFDHGRRSVTVLLSDLARVLPDSSALVACHVDSTGGSIVVLTPRAGALLTRLERVPEVASPEITGPVTHETARGHEVERVTVRFRWNHQ